MIIWVLQQLLLCRKALLAKDSPRQLAWALALGMVIGLVPKGNLLAVVLSLIVLSVRVNLPVALLSALVFSVLGMWLDPLTHRLGKLLLDVPALRALGVRLYELPLVPWTSLHNTVVLGSFVLSGTLLYPAYRLALGRFEWLADRRRRRAESEAEAELPATDDAAPTPCAADASRVAMARGKAAQEQPPLEEKQPAHPSGDAPATVSPATVSPATISPATPPISARCLP